MQGRRWLYTGCLQVRSWFIEPALGGESTLECVGVGEQRHREGASLSRFPANRWSGGAPLGEIETLARKR